MAGQISRNKVVSEKFSDLWTMPPKGDGKIIELSEAIKRHIKPGMSIYVREGSYAALRELIRQFWNSEPKFTLIMLGCRDYALDLIHCKLVTRLITARCSESATQGRSLIVQRAYEKGLLEIENWSLYSLTLRLMAAALELPFLPTRSILESSMVEENRESFMEAEDPFGTNMKVGLLKPLSPDIAIVHAWAADSEGNLITAPAILSGEGEWGVFASRGGVIATVEKIVSSEFIREHSSLVKIPGSFVRSVSLAPFGAHPQTFVPVWDELEGYEADFDFMEGHWQASQHAATLDLWIKEWILDCPSNEDYLRKLSHERLALLKGSGAKDMWKYRSLELIRKAPQATSYNANEMMIIGASRVIKQSVTNKGYRIIISGVGTAGLAAWLAYYGLKEENIDVELMLGSGLYGWVPYPNDLRLESFSRIRSCKMITDVVHAYGVFAHNKCLSVLGAGQVDKHGNLNSTKLSESFYLTGSGGANDAALADEVIVVIPQARRRFVDKLPYITCSGKRVKTVVSDKGVFEKKDGELIFMAYFGDVDKPEEIMREVQSECGWELKVDPELHRIDPPTHEELALLRLLDPRIISRTEGG